MASNLTALSVWEFLKVKAGALFTLNAGAAKEVTYATDAATGETVISIGSEVVQRRSAGSHRIMSESTLGPERIQNGNCETFTNGLVTGWGEYDPAGNLTPSEETVDVYAGSKSQRLTRTASGSYSAVTSNYMAMTKDKWYVASFAVKLLSGDHIRVWINTSDSIVTLYNFGNLSPSEWTVYSAPFRCRETRTNYVFRFDSDLTPFTALIDNVSVREITAGSLYVGDEVHVGGALSVAEAISSEADITARTGVTAGIAGTRRGVVKATRGSGTSQPGVVVLQARDGTEYYEWRTATGDRRVDTILPTSDADGTDAIHTEDGLSTDGNVDADGAVTAGGNVTSGGNVSASGNLSGVDVTATGKASIGGDASVGGKATVTGDATVGGKLDVTNVTTLRAALSVLAGITANGNVYSGGNVTASLGLVAAGSYGIARGRFVAVQGPGGDEPGYVLLYGPSGTPGYLFIGLGGMLRRHTDIPGALDDGVQVGAQIIEGDFQVGEALATPGMVTIHGDGDGTGGLLRLFSPNGTPYYFWVTNAGVMRRHTAVPTNWDTDGAVVGPGI